MATLTTSSTSSTLTSSSTSSFSVSLITDSGLISSYNRGPLITVFTPPATCLSTLTFVQSMYFGHSGSSYFDPACFPTSITPSQVTSDTWAMYYYSPGQCPSGWFHATTLTSSFPAAFESPIALSIGAETTAVVCCPSGYYYPLNGIGHQCQSTFTTVNTLLYVQPTLVENSYARGNASTTIPTVSYNIYGDGIPIWWQSSDEVSFTATSPLTSSLASSTNVGTSAPTATSTSSPFPLPSTESSGLSDGVKAAIGVCVSLSVIVVLTGFFFCFRRRQREQRQNQASMVRDPVPEISNERAVSELYSNQHTELHSNQRMELPLNQRGD